MAENTTLTLTDAESTPVARAFAPGPLTGEQTVYTNRAGGKLIGYGKVRLRVHEASGNEQYSRVVLTIVDPILEVASGNTGSGLQAAPTLAYTNFLEVTLRAHRRSTEQERKNARVMLIDALAEALITDSFDKLAIPY